MDQTVINSHYEIIARHYPTINVTQLGMVMIMLGAIRSSMGHEGAKGTVTSYIHKEQLSPEIQECINFIECEILCMRKSRIDIDYWKIGNTGAFRDS